ncbi:MAG: AAA family ATPase [Acidimicrobiia bacterium]|nr:AAA family ATPase [Acidimicrobiia bacterium]
MITLVSRSTAFEQRVRRAFGNDLNGDVRRWQGDYAADPIHAIIDLTRDDPRVVAIGPDHPLATALAIAHGIDETRPEISVVLIADPTPDLYEAALRAGVRDVVESKASGPELRAALERASQTTAMRRRGSTAPDKALGTTGRVITVAAPKGGSGKTAIAANLGVGLAQSLPGRVVIVDLDLQFGDITNAFGLEPDITISDVTALPGRLDGARLKAALTSWNEQLFVLCAPDDPSAGDEIHEGQIHSILDLLAREFDYVVVDTPAGVAEGTLAALEKTTDLFLVCDLSVAGVRSMRKLVDALDRLEMTAANRWYFLNRADSKVGVKLEEASEATGIDFNFRLPSSRAVPLSMNRGAPIVASTPRAAFSRVVLDAVNQLTSTDEPLRSRWKVAR